MAYLALVDYDEGGRIQSLDGLAAVSYDDGAKRNLLGANLGAVKYDDGGRFRTLLGMGQDAVDMPPPDVGIDTSITSAFPISYTPPSPAPSFVPYVPSPAVDTQSAPITGALFNTVPAATPPPTSLLTSIFSGVTNVLQSATALAAPKTAGTIVPTAPAASAPASAAPSAATASWFSQQSIISGLPNWGILAGGGLGLVVLMAAMRGGSSGGGSRRRNPARRRNGMELVLMGANPARGWAH